MFVGRKEDTQEEGEISGGWEDGQRLRETGRDGLEEGGLLGRQEGLLQPQEGEGHWPRGGLCPGRGQGDPTGSQALSNPTIFPGPETRLPAGNSGGTSRKEGGRRGRGPPGSWHQGQRETQGQERRGWRKAGVQWGCLSSTVGSAAPSLPALAPDSLRCCRTPGR